MLAQFLPTRDRKCDLVCASRFYSSLAMFYSVGSCHTVTFITTRHNDLILWNELRVGNHKRISPVNAFSNKARNG